jgi:predicted PurR-regulated permease PerM
MTSGDPAGEVRPMIDREPPDAAETRGASVGTRFGETAGAGSGPPPLPIALERRIVGFQKPATGASRLRGAMSGAPTQPERSLLMSAPAESSRPEAAAAAQRRAAGGWLWLRADVVLLAIGLGLLLWLTGHVLLVVFAGVLLAVALDALGTLVSRYTPLPRGWAVVAVMVALVLLLGAGALAIVPQFMEQLGQIWERLSALAGQAQRAVERYPWMQQMLGMGGEQGGENGQGMGGAAGNVAGHVATATMTILGTVGTVIVVVVLGLFMAADPALYRGGLVRLVPPRHRPRAEETLATAGHALRWWLLGQLVSMLMLGVTTSVGLLVLGVEQWLGLGVLVGLLTFIPFLGPVIAGIPVVLLGFMEGTGTGLAALAFYLVVQNLEGNIITPLIQQRAVSLPPALLISMQVLLGTLFGAAGLILAAPLAVVGMVAVNLLYIEDVLGDRRFI